MEKNHQAYYREKLLALRTELEAQIAQTAEERAPVTVDGRMGRISRGDAMQVQQMAIETNRRREQQLSRIQTALERMRSGTYGLCGRCQQPIAAARLDAMPDVVMCVNCAGTGARR
ncbi:MAG: TraR/DksA family transcriptional regulator [Kiritimatiellia bacterium]